MIKFSHSVFALPFALVAVLYAKHGLPSWNLVGLIVAAMVTARSAAMAFNRWLDADMDAQNPRTKNRHIPSGLLSKNFVLAFSIFNCAAFVFTTYWINLTALALSIPTLFILLGYSYTKRMGTFSHLVLGLALGLAPVGAWIATTGQIISPALWLCAAVTCWVAGFDIIYSCQDMDFDRGYDKIYSIPKKLGIPGALMVSKILHVFFFTLLMIFIADVGAGNPAQYGLAMVAGFLIYEHFLLKDNSLAKVNAAFFNANGLIALGFLAFVFVDVMM